MDFADALVDPEGGAPEVPLVPHQLQPLLRVKQLLFVATIISSLLAVTSFSVYQNQKHFYSFAVDSLRIKTKNLSFIYHELPS